MKSIVKLLPLIITFLVATSVEAIVYTWTGGGGDGDWNNTSNWDANGVPVDTDGSKGLTLNSTDPIVFSGATVPTSNMPSLGGVNNNNGVTPALDLRSGGTLAVTLDAGISGVVSRPAINRTVLTVGDGVGTPVFMNVALTGDSLSRDPAGVTHDFRVNSDGRLSFDSLLDFSSTPSDRWATLTIDGGIVSVNGAVQDLNAHANNFVNFTAPGGMFTANYGNDFADINAVLAEVQAGNSSFRASAGIALRALDNGNGSFTVSIDDGSVPPPPPPPASAYVWTGAVDGDWNNAGNWNGNGVPVDADPTTPVLTFNSPDGLIAFTGESLPTSNIPQLGGVNNNDGVTPALDLRSGGSLSVTLNGVLGGVVTRPTTNRTVLTVGDGVGTPVIMNVALNNNNLSRDPGGVTHDYRVNADGTLNFDSSLVISSNSADRWATLTVDGGIITVDGSVQELNGHANNYVNFTAPGGVFTANYGSDFVDLNAVLGELQTGNSSFRASTGINLKAEDNGDGTFTVSVDDGNNNRAPQFTDNPITRPAASVDVNYNKTISGSATDADGDTLTYVKLSGPAWLNVASDGALSGAPASSDLGMNSWTVRVSDGNSRSADATLSIFVTTLASSDVNVLIIGSTRDSQEVYSGGTAAPFNPTQIANEFRNILEGAGLGSVNVTIEERYDNQNTPLGSWAPTRCYTLASWYHWPFPAGVETDSRWPNLRGELGIEWDYVVLIGDPYTVEKTPGLYAQGVAKIAEEVAKGTAQTMLLMPWPASSSSSSVNHYKEVVYRAGRSGGIPVAPAALAWQSAGSPSLLSQHPNQDGAYIAAATLYSRMYGQNASTSSYTYNNTFADTAHTTVSDNVGQAQYSGKFNFQNPYLMLDDKRRVVRFSERGSSTEQGFKSTVTSSLERIGLSADSSFSDKYSSNTPEDDGRGWPTAEPMPISFNFGRDGIISESEKAYVVNPDYWQLGFGYYYHYNTWSLSVEEANDHYLGFMHAQDNNLANRMLSQGPSARNVPVRTLWAQIHREYPSLNPQRDGGGPHLDYNEDEAVGAYITTLYSGRCPLDPKPYPMTVAWFSQKVGYETAWRMGRVQTRAPGFKVKPTSPTATAVTPSTTQTLAVQFIFEPRSAVTVTVNSDDPGAGRASPSTLTFTPENYDVPQEVSVYGVTGTAGTHNFNVLLTTASEDAAYDEVADSWDFQNTRAEGPPPDAVTVNHGVPHAWLSAINSSWSGDYEAAALTDHDQDGFPTWQEYWSGTDPQDSDSSFKIDSITIDGSNVVLKWQHASINEEIPDIVIESRADLSTGTWDSVGLKAPVNGLNLWSEEFSLEAPPEFFYRLRATESP